MLNERCTVWPVGEGARRRMAQCLPEMSIHKRTRVGVSCLPLAVQAIQKTMMNAIQKHVMSTALYAYLDVDGWQAVCVCPL